MIDHILKIPTGYSQGVYNHKKYGITKTVHNNGKSFKIYGKELGGTDFISLNYYITEKKDILKPCEMTSDKVIHFMTHIKIN